MTIREEGRPATGGQWCGSAWGYTVYYSETPSINLTLYLLRLSEQVRNCVGRKRVSPPAVAPRLRPSYGTRAFVFFFFTEVKGCRDFRVEHQREGLFPRLFLLLARISCLISFEFKENHFAVCVANNCTHRNRLRAIEICPASNPPASRDSTPRSERRSEQRPREVFCPYQGIGYNFDFKLSYKFLRRSEAHLRYGNSSMSTWRGELVNGTYCDRVLTKCDTRACRLQSPNYPGVYPRNVTCYYRVEQNRAPVGHRALLAVSQRNSHKIHIKDQVVKYDRSQRVLR